MLRCAVLLSAALHATRCCLRGHAVCTAPLAHNNTPNNNNRPNQGFWWRQSPCSHPAGCSAGVVLDRAHSMPCVHGHGMTWHGATHAHTQGTGGMLQPPLPELRPTGPLHPTPSRAHL